MEYWAKQSVDQPAFPDLLWSRPERRDQAGKLLIIGGNDHHFTAPAEAYRYATEAGVGVGRVMLPSSLQKIIHTIFPEAEYATSNPSGGFATQAVDELVAAGQWSDGVLLAGDVGHNSQTVIALESFLRIYDGPVTLSGDAIDCILSSAANILTRPETALVVTLAELQKLLLHAQSPVTVTQDMDLLRLVPALHTISNRSQAHFIIKTNSHSIVATAGQVSSTTSSATDWPLKTAATAAVWWLQHPNHAFEALTTALYSQSKEN